MTLRIARIDPSRGGGIIETRGKLWDFRNKNKYSNFVLRTSKIVDFWDLPEILYRISRILPYITVRDRGGTAIYTSPISQLPGAPKLQSVGA